MNKQDLNDVKNRDLIDKFIKSKIKKDCYNVLDDYYIMFDKDGNATLLLSFLILSRFHYTDRTFELYTLDIKNGKIVTTQASHCDILEYKNTRFPRIYINYIGTYEKQFVGKGYNYMILRAVEQYALEHSAKKLYGLYMPMIPGSDQTAHKFYERNKFEHYYDYSGESPEDMIEKKKLNFRSLSFSTINGLKTSSDVFERCNEETYTTLC